MFRRELIIMLTLYLVSIILGNLIVFHLGRAGILITSFIFIPFDFVVRCYIHEKHKGKNLYKVLFSVIALGAILTFLINHESKEIAFASVCGFVIAGITGSLTYQILIEKKSLYKVNISDVVAIVFDSIVFQMIAFESFVISVTAGQIFIKIIGGLLWYWILFSQMKLMKKIKNY